MPHFYSLFYKKKQVIIFFVVLGLIVLSLLGKTLLLRTFHVLQSPFVSFGTWTTQKYESSIGNYYLKGKDFDRLIEERNAYAVDRVEYETLKQENEMLLKELGFTKRNSSRWQTASIIGRVASNRTATLLINIGSDQGVIKGSAVIVGDGIFIGKISKVDRVQSVVSVSTDYITETAVTLFNQTRTIGIAQGSTGNLLELKFIPSDEVIKVNDLVVTSGLEERVPPGLLVGIVNLVKPDSEAPFQHAVLQPLVDIRRIVHVLVFNPPFI